MSSLLLPFVLAAQSIQLTLPAGEYARENTPVFFSVPEKLSDGDFFLLTDAESKEQVIAQRYNRDSAVFLLKGPVETGEGRSYRLEKAGRRLASGVILRQDDEKIGIRVQDRPVLVYHTATVEPPAGAPAYYRRSGHIHPLYSPGGQVLSDGFPVGHTHQHGVFFAWVNTTFRGEKVDFWNQQDEMGTVRHVAVLDTVSGPVFARLKVKLEHVSLKHGPVLEEEMTITVFNSRERFLVDIQSDQWGVTEDTLYLNKYDYGGMAFRGSARWNEADSLNYRTPMQVVTSDGTTRAEANHTRPRWVAAYGDIEGTTAGLALFDHPSNFRFPQPVRVHPDMPYFVYTPTVEEGFWIGPGEHYRSQYRFWIFEGMPDLNEIEEAWRGYAVPSSFSE